MPACHSRRLLENWQMREHEQREEEMRVSNYYVYSEDSDRLLTLKDEYESMGFRTKVEGSRLTVYSTSPKKARQKREARPRKSE